MKFAIFFILISQVISADQIFNYYRNETANVVDIVEFDDSYLALTPFDIISVNNNDYQRFSNNLNVENNDFRRMLKFKDQLFLYDNEGAGYFFKDNLERFEITEGIIDAQSTNDILLIVSNKAPQLNFFDGENKVSFSISEDKLKKDEINIQTFNTKFYIDYNKSNTDKHYFYEYDSETSVFKEIFNPGLVEYISTIHGTKGSIYEISNDPNPFIYTNIGIRKYENGTIGDEIILDQPEQGYISNFFKLNDRYYCTSDLGVFIFDKKKNIFKKVYDLAKTIRKQNPKIYKSNDAVYIHFEDKLHRFDYQNNPTVTLTSNANIFLVNGEIIAELGGNIFSPYSDKINYAQKNKIYSNDILFSDIYKDELIFLTKQNNSLQINEYKNGKWDYHNLDSIMMWEGDSKAYSLLKTGEGKYHLSNTQYYFYKENDIWKKFDFFSNEPKDLVLESINLFGKDNDGRIYASLEIGNYTDLRKDKDFIVIEDGEYKKLNLEDEPSDKNSRIHSLNTNNSFFIFYESGEEYEDGILDPVLLEYKDGVQIDKIYVEKNPSNPIFCYFKGFSVSDNEYYFASGAKETYHKDYGSYLTRGGVSIYKNNDWEFVQDFSEHPIEELKRQPSVDWYKDYGSFKLMYSGGLIFINEDDWYIYDESDRYYDIDAERILDFGERVLITSKNQGVIEFDPLKVSKYSTYETVDHFEIIRQQSTIKIEGKTGYQIHIYDLHGHLILNELIYNTFIYDLQMLKDGPYFVKLIKDGKIESATFIVGE